MHLNFAFIETLCNDTSDQAVYLLYNIRYHFMWGYHNKYVNIIWPTPTLTPSP